MSKKYLVMFMIFLVLLLGCNKKEEDILPERDTDLQENNNVDDLTSKETQNEDMSKIEEKEQSSNPQITNEPDNKMSVAPTEVSELTNTPTPTVIIKATPTIKPTPTSIQIVTPSPSPTLNPTNTPTPTITPMPTATPTPTATPVPTVEPKPEITDVPDSGYDNTTDWEIIQSNSRNMLNYLAVLNQKISDSRSNRMYLESVYNSLKNDMYPNAVDTDTQAQISSLLDTIYEYQMVGKKRERLQYIYEQNQAQAFREAIPNPLSILNVVKSETPLKAALSAVYLAVESINKYQSAQNQASLQYIQEGWELDDKEFATLHESTKASLNYMYDMVRMYDLEGDDILNSEAIEKYVNWTSKPDSQRANKIAWLEKEEPTYSKYGYYWLELAKDYYDDENYRKCLDSIGRYEEIMTRIFRKDTEYAKILTYGIVSAKYSLSQNEYINLAKNYCEKILKNSKEDDWEIRYFVAITYLDLAKIDNSKGAKYTNLYDAYKIIKENVIYLVEKQKELNIEYLNDFVEEPTPNDANKRQKNEIKEYNKINKKEHDKAVPPVYEPLYLNLDLLFGLIEECDIPINSQKKIDNILHENDGMLFLSKSLDDKFWLTRETYSINADSIVVKYDGTSIVIPAYCMTDKSIVIVRFSQNEEIDDWIISSVERPENTNHYGFKVTLKSEKASNIKYSIGDIVTVKVIPFRNLPEKYYEFKFKYSNWEDYAFGKDIQFFERIHE